MPIKQNPKFDPRYFTAVLQLRFPSEEALRFVYDAVDNDKDKNFISKEEEQPNGVDFYLSSNKFSRRLGKQLVEKFGGTLGEYERLFSYNRERSKNIYRMNILVELPIFARNDVIRFNKKTYLIKTIGRNVHVKDLAMNKDTTTPYKNIKEFEILKKIETRVARIHPKLSVFDEDNQMIDVSNKPDKEKEFKIGEKVKVVYSLGACYVI